MEKIFGIEDVQVNIRSHDKNGVLGIYVKRAFATQVESQREVDETKVWLANKSPTYITPSLV